MFGNGRASKFTESQATDFAAKYTVVAHQANTATGFSGTLFKNVSTGEFTLSFRSTEFIDDAGRDNQATNALEIRPYGWAFGQIDDMKKWVDDLYASNKITTTAPLNVTGYSLGGHLAAAFNLLYPAAASETYTFNGAGVGKLTGSSNLSQVIATFDSRRGQGTNTDLFTDPSAATTYNTLKSKFSGTSTFSISGLDTELNAIGTQISVLSVSTNTQGYSQFQLLQSALMRVREIAGETLRVVGMPSGTGVPSSEAGTVPVTTIAATGLDYQLAVLFAAKNTAS